MAHRKSGLGVISLAAALLLAAMALPASADSFGEAVRAEAAPIHSTHLSVSAALSASPRLLATLRRQPLDQPRLAAFALRESDVHLNPADEHTQFGVSFPIKWQKEPQIVTTARKFRRQGLPLVHLWQSDSGEHVLAIGLNPHGVPGIWFTQKVPD
jgi:hypothetical protein